jgi:hypothetical protein
MIHRYMPIGLAYGMYLHCQHPHVPRSPCGHGEPFLTLSIFPFLTGKDLWNRWVRYRFTAPTTNLSLGFQHIWQHHAAFLLIYIIINNTSYIRHKHFKSSRAYSERVASFEGGRSSHHGHEKLNKQPRNCPISVVPFICNPFHTGQFHDCVQGLGRSRQSHFI